MTDSARLGGGYATAKLNPRPTADALRAAALPGSPHARLIVLAGPPGVGKSCLAQALIELIPESLLIDKDHTAGGFVLEAAVLRGDDADRAYAAEHYWEKLRPIEYAGPLRQACINLVGRRSVILVGGWGPELGVAALWTDLQERLSPSRLCVLHLDPPPLDTWCARLSARDSRCDRPYVEQLARHIGQLPVWHQAKRIAAEGSIETVVQRALNALNEAPEA